MMGRAGNYRSVKTGDESYRIFYPNDLPPVPALSLSGTDLDLMDRANRALGRLDGLSTVLPSMALFLYMYVRKEALLSSQIEGTQSSFSELLLAESEDAPGVPVDDVRDVSSYVSAMEYGLERLDSLPLSLRLMREIHGILLKDGRGSTLTPGEFRRSQNWIGGSRPGNALFVPPPPEELSDRLGALEKFLHNDPEQTPLLIKAALAHCQFETIHPFLDGNGRLGRLLVTFLLCSEGALSQPILYLSLYFKRNRTKYYELLQRVRDEGVWEEWVRFFLEGVLLVSEQATDTARRILNLFEVDRDQIQKLPSKVSSLLRVHEALKSAPILRVARAARITGLSEPTVRSCFNILIENEIVRELSGKKRDRLYVYDPYLQILEEGTEPLKRS